MMISTPATDNLSEILGMVIAFTQTRRSLLAENLRSRDNPGFRPQDLPVLEFSECIQQALTEHIQSHRLLWQDTQTLRFGPEGSMEVCPMPDPEGAALLATDVQGYLRYLVDKIVENDVNEKVALDLLKMNRSSAIQRERMRLFRQGLRQRSSMTR